MDRDLVFDLLFAFCLHVHRNSHIFFPFIIFIIINQLLFWFLLVLFEFNDFGLEEGERRVRQLIRAVDKELLEEFGVKFGKDKRQSAMGQRR